jgi:SRSO17 transposase
LAIGRDFQVTTSGHVKMRADRTLTLVESRGWNRHSCGNGSKGRHLHDWAWIATASACHRLLIRRSTSDLTELAHYVVYVPGHYVCSLTGLVKVAGIRWAIEDDFQDANKRSASRSHPGARLPGLEAAHRPRTHNMTAHICYLPTNSDCHTR